MYIYIQHISNILLKIQIWILTGVLIYLAIDRIIHQEYDIDADTMIIVSGIGVVMNIA